MASLALLRHGQSQWNLENRFTGWVDVDLTPEGESQARHAGTLLHDSAIALDSVHTSVLTRAIRTANLAIEALGEAWLPLIKDWRLNERHYGALTGLDKAQTAKLHGEAQVHIWRRSFDIPPPPLEPGNAYAFEADRRYAQVAHIPTTESLKTTLERVAPYYDGVLVPAVQSGCTLLIVAHGNSLRAIVKRLMGLSDEAVIALEIPTGNPLLLDIAADMRVQAARYLDPKRAQPLPALPLAG